MYAFGYLQPGEHGKSIHGKPVMNNTPIPIRFMADISSLN